jgi:predicted metal-dependent hydrolase
MAAWRRGDWFETHELLEPAWMGTDDVAERLRLQAAIKVAAAFVHRARGNRRGVHTNLAGARARLADARDAGAAVGGFAGEVDRLLEDVEDESVPLEGIEAPDLPGLVAAPD